jgi:CubicO group peptidase (beta-lactamase class C family)
MGSRATAGGAFDAVRELIRARLVEQSVPSLAVAVARHGEIIWEEGFGWADREERAPATEHTLYSLASISKPITATGLMVLKEQGKLDTDRPANEYLGAAKLTAWVGDAADATVRRVANHTSGLPLHAHFFYEDEPYPRPPMDETIRRYGNLVAPPGEKYQYSNLGYGILDHIISRLSGKSYPEFMREEVFLPLGMTRASVDIGPGLERHAAARYGADGIQIPFYTFDHPGGSAVYCSAHDLVRFGMFHLKARLSDQKAVLSDSAIDEMQDATARTGESSGYGVGWAINEDRLGYRAIGHGGGMGGVATALEMIPSEGLVVAALVNGNSDLPWVVAEEIFSLLLPEYEQRRAEKQERERAEKEQREKEQAEKPDGRFVAAPELVGVWGGSVHTYQGEIPFTLEFREAGDIHARLGEPSAAFRRGGRNFASAPQPWTLLNDAAWKDEKLTGRMMGELGTEDAGRLPHQLHADLRLWGEVLNGALLAISEPRPRSGFALSHWVELRKEK